MSNRINALVEEHHQLEEQLQEFFRGYKDLVVPVTARLSKLTWVLNEEIEKFFEERGFHIKITPGKAFILVATDGETVFYGNSYAELFESYMFEEGMRQSNA